MNKKHNLEDCPWCESAKKLDFDTRKFGCMDPFRYKSFVYCNRCGARGCYATSKEIAAERWNQVMGKVRRFEEGKETKPTLPPFERPKDCPYEF